ncbi:hypothetical protein VPH35_126590 [Triticum aestivum]|nr:BTB/POZ and MATH domain-containing protein 2-like [Triticum aestivum]
MPFAGVSVISRGKLLEDTFPMPVINASAASGYHLLIVEEYSCTSRSAVSRSFTVGGHTWRIYYYPDDDGFISLNLYLHEEPTATPVKAQYKFSFIDESDKQESARIHRLKIFEFQAYSMNSCGRLMTRENLGKSKHFKNDSFTIRCDIVVINNVTTTTTSEFKEIEVPSSDMQRNFMDLLLTGEGTDVVFEVGGETFAAHRCILAARSTVFRALLFGPMKEGTSTMVQVNDMDPNVFKTMLDFIYGDSLLVPEAGENSWVLLQHLLVAADRYDLQRLKHMCEKKLCEHISVSTATTVLALADEQGCGELKKACYGFLRCPVNLRAVVDTEGFDHIQGSCPHLIKDIIFGVLPS